MTLPRVAHVENKISRLLRQILSACDFILHRRNSGVFICALNHLAEAYREMTHINPPLAHLVLKVAIIWLCLIMELQIYHYIFIVFIFSSSFPYCLILKRYLMFLDLYKYTDGFWKWFCFISLENSILWKAIASFCRILILRKM